MLRHRGHDSPLPPAVHVSLEHQLRRTDTRTEIPSEHHQTQIQHLGRVARYFVKTRQAGEQECLGARDPLGRGGYKVNVATGDQGSMLSNDSRRNIISKNTEWVVDHELRSNDV